MSAVPNQPAQASHTDKLTDLRLQLRRNGYVPVPVTNPNATWAGKSAGKRPGLDTDWLNKAKAANENAIRSWPQSDPDCTNTGILTGDVTAVDVDVPLPELSEDILKLAEKMLPSGALRRSAGGPKFLLLFQCEPGSTKTVTPKLLVPGPDGESVACQVEVMATGQQIVAYGHHPSGKPYIWHGESPETTPKDQLPLVTTDQIAAFLVAAEELLREAGGRTNAEIKAQEKTQETAPEKAQEKQSDAGQTTVSRSAPPSQEGRKKQKAKGEKQEAETSPLHRLNEIAVTPDNLELWVPLLFPTAKFQEGTGAWRVKPADLGHDYEEDLSISPMGICYFGEEVSYTPVNLVCKYGAPFGIENEDSADSKAAIEWLVDQLGMVWPRDFQDRKPELKIGSDVEIAEKLAEKLRRDHDGRVVAAEGQIYLYDGRQWAPIPDRELELLVHQYDGALFHDAAEKRAVVRLSSGKINSILKVLTTVLTTDETFFANPATGINALNGLIRIVGEGKAARVEVVPHDPEHRHRHVVPGEYRPERKLTHDLVLEDPLLGKLLTGCFKGEPDAIAKWYLLAEVTGVAAAGAVLMMGQEQQAVILLGVKSGNGKSQVLDVMRGLLPASAVCSIPPADFQDEKKLIPLVGKLLNATDEISSSNAITSELFKKIVTCNPTTARDLYKSVVTFKPQAQHVMNANGLPPLKGGLGPADIRRLKVIPFNRRIPKEERIPHLGERIVREEMDLVLAWAVEGLLQVARNGWLFTELAASVELIEDWLDSTCPVTRFLNSDQVSVVPPTAGGRGYSVRTAAAYKRFQEYERAEGLRGDHPISFNTFTNRVKASDLGVEYKRTKTERLFLNLKLTGDYDQDDIIILEDRKRGGGKATAG